MKTNHLALLTAAGLAICATCTAATDLPGRARLRAERIGLSSTGTVRKPSVRKSAPGAAKREVRGFLTLKPGHDISEIEKLDWVKVTRSRSSAIFAAVDAEKVDALSAHEAVKSFRIESPVRPRLDNVRRLTGVDCIHSGTTLPRPFTGKGVITGIVDGGFDPNHINFKNADGSSRIQRFIYFRPTEEGETVMEIHNSEYIPQIDTEMSETFHGTHTLGIMAGGYRGEVEHARLSATGVEITSGANPYYGIACGSDIAAAGGAQSDYLIAQAIEAMLDYAYSKGKPLVVNLSLGSNLGPHDGTSPLCQYLDEMSELDNVVFCIAAGNEGTLPISLSKTLSEGDMELKSMFWGNDQMAGYPNMRFGQTMFYSDSEAPFEIQALVLDKRKNQVLLRLPMPATEFGGEKYIVTGAEWASSGDILSPVLAEYFEGYLGVAGAWDDASGRYSAMIDLGLFDKTDGKNWNGDYVIAFQVTGSKPGQRIDVYGDGQMNYFTSYGVAGYEDGITDGTISDLATGHNYVSVGSYNSRDSWGALDNFAYTYERAYPEGEISDFSSYGTLIDGRTLPVVCAPGVGVISSANEYYLEEYGQGDGDLQARTEADGRTHSWFQCMGTSMAAPVVSGSIALWLESKPDLTGKEVIDIIRSTSTVDDKVTVTGCAAQWGAGKFNALEGLKAVFGRGGVEAPVLNTPIVELAGPNRYILTSAVNCETTAKVVSIDGTEVMNLRSQDGSLSVDLSALQNGIYFICLDRHQAVRVIR